MRGRLSQLWNTKFRWLEVEVPGSWLGWSDDGPLELAAAVAAVVAVVVAATVEPPPPGPPPSASRRSSPTGPERAVAYSCCLKEEDGEEEKVRLKLVQTKNGAAKFFFIFRPKCNEFGRSRQIFFLQIFGGFRKKTSADVSVVSGSASGRRSHRSPIFFRRNFCFPNYFFSDFFSSRRNETKPTKLFLEAEKKRFRKVLVFLLRRTS